MWSNDHTHRPVQERGTGFRALPLQREVRRMTTHSGPSQRQLRVGEQVRHALADVLARGEIRDDIIENTVISVSEVRMSPDLKIATAFVAPLAAKDDDAVIKALAQNAKFIRGRVSGALRQMKYMPEFRFRLDTSYDNLARIDDLLRSPEVARDLDKGDDSVDD